MEELLKDLMRSRGVSGSESQVRSVINSHVEEHADKIQVDNMGNLVATKGSGEKTLMVAAHMDQIGLSVMNVTDEGFISFSKVGGVTLQSLMNQRVEVITEDGDSVEGVIGMKPPHLMDSEKRDSLPEKESLFIDVGADSAEEVEDDFGIRVGNRIVFDREPSEINGLVTGPAMDNRVGCAVAIEMLKRFDEDYELSVVFSVQEEVGLKGAKTAAFKVDPDAALAVDVSIAGDVPGVEPNESDIGLGDGIELTLIQGEGRGLITSEKVRDWMVDTAKNNDRDFNRAVGEGGATDAAKIYLQREGIPTGSVGVPLRNMHSATEVVDPEDMQEAADFFEDLSGSFEQYF
jgi:endoglucanase